MDLPELTEEELNDIFNWVDEIPLTRPKKNIARDFSDGVLAAEVISHYFPEMVELHNYCSANSVQQKTYNWTTLNFFKKLGFMFNKNDINAVISCKQSSIERILKVMKDMITKRLEQNEQRKNIQKEKASLIQKQQQDSQQEIEQSQQVYQQEYQGIHSKMIQEKDRTIGELSETVQILELKIQKLEQLVTLKDNKIHALVQKLAQQGN